MERLSKAISMRISRALFRMGPSLIELEKTLDEGDRGSKMELLRRVLDECPRIETDREPDPRFEPLQRALTTERDVFVLSFLVRTVSHLGGSGTVRALAPMLKHGDARVVANTLESMAKTGDETVFTLALPLVGREEPRIRATALAVLCRYDRAAAIQALVHFLKTSRRPEEKRGALQALKAVGEVPSSVLEAVRDEVTDPDVRAMLERILEEATPSGANRAALWMRHRVERFTGRRAAGALRPAALVLALGVAAIGLLAWTRGTNRPGPIGDLARGITGHTPRSMALEPLSRIAGKPVTWSGTVLERTGDGLFVSCSGTRVRIAAAALPQTVSRGDRVDVSGRVEGRTATGTVFLEGATVKVVERVSRLPQTVVTDRSYVEGMFLAESLTEARGIPRERLRSDADAAWVARMKGAGR